MDSSSQRSSGPGLTRFVSAPGSLLKSIVHSIIEDDDFSAVGSEGMISRFYSGESSCLSTASESTCKPNTSNVASSADYSTQGEKMGGLQRSYGLNDIAVGGDYLTAGNLKSGPSLIRHSSSPAGFLSQLVVDNGFSVSRGIGNFSSQAGYDGGHGMGNRMLKSQLSFSKQDSLSQFSEVSIPEIGESVAGHNGSDDTTANVGQSYMSGTFSMGSWDDTNSIVFSTSPTKRAKDINGNVVTSIGSLESQLSLPQTSLEMATVEKLLQMQPESVPCKIRAKRGFATHPRSIAERDRRTRISKKLRRLQELVPNMDKQTNTAEMLDMALQHIKGLQSQVQMLKQERANCTCESKQTE